MLSQFVRGSFRLKAGVVSLALVGAMVVSGVYFALTPTPKAEAHCDSINGPVVHAAQEALDENDVKLILPYVQPESEEELTRVFEHTQEVRQLGGEARELADRFFFETAVRLHRAGEGAPYTGLKMDKDFGPALTEADRTLETGSLDGIYALLDQTIKEGVAAKYEVVVEARELAAREGTVEANRERAEAELGFETYVYGLYETAKGNVTHGEGTQAEVQEAGSEGASGHSH